MGESLFNQWREALARIEKNLEEIERMREKQREFPDFDGTHLEDWLYKCQRYFELERVPEENKVSLASLYMYRGALQWHYTYIRNRTPGLPLGWEEYTAALNQRFGAEVSTMIIEEDRSDFVAVIKEKEGEDEDMDDKGVQVILQSIDVPPAYSVEEEDDEDKDGESEDVKEDIVDIDDEELFELRSFEDLGESFIVDFYRKGSSTFFRPYGLISHPIKFDLCRMSEAQKGDCDFDLGGYFLVMGAERTPARGVVIKMEADRGGGLSSRGKGEISVAESPFREMHENDVVSWNSMLSEFSLNGKSLKRVEIFSEMRINGDEADQTSFVVVLKACAFFDMVQLGVQNHRLTVKMGFDQNVVIASALVDMYGKRRKKLRWAIQQFQEMPERNWVSWSAVIARCVHNDELILMYRKMLRSGCGASQSTYVNALRSCTRLCAFEIGSQLNAHAMKNDFGGDIVVVTVTLDMYAKCDSYGDARKVFDFMPWRSFQTFNAMIVGYARQNHGRDARELICLLQKFRLWFDEITLSGALSSCAAVKGFVEGLQVLVLTIKCCFCYNVTVQDALLDMYGKCGTLREASRVFSEMDLHDVVYWNPAIAAHEQSDSAKETMELYVSMLRTRKEPDKYTYGSVLKACAEDQALNSGMEIHNRIIKSGMRLDLFVGGSLVDMYSKCGMVEEAEKIYQRITEHTLVSWNAMLSGLTMLKQSEDAQGYFPVCWIWGLSLTTSLLPRFSILKEGRRTVKRGNWVVTKVLVLWNRGKEENATWEFIFDLERQYSDWTLEDNCL